MQLAHSAGNREMTTRGQFRLVKRRLLRATLTPLACVDSPRALLGCGVSVSLSHLHVASVRPYAWSFGQQSDVNDRFGRFLSINCKQVEETCDCVVSVATGLPFSQSIWMQTVGAPRIAWT
jgi:hypothetical protein